MMKNTFTATLLASFCLPGAVALTSAADEFHSGGFAQAPDGRSTSRRRRCSATR